MRTDSRLDAGIKDPRTGQAVASNATHWYVASGDAPPLEFSFLNPAPSLRAYPLRQGEWGIGFDVKWDVAAEATEPRGIYKGAPA